MKRISVLLLALTMVLSMTACGGSGTGSKSTEAPSTGTTEPAPAPSKPSGVDEDGMGEDPNHGEGIGEVIALSDGEKEYVSAQTTNTWLEMSDQEKDELVVLVGRWLEDASGFVVEDYDDLVVMLDRQMEQYFKNGVNEGLLATVCDILGADMPADAPAAKPGGLDEDGMGDDPTYGEGVGEVIALSEEEKDYVLAQTTNTWLELSTQQKDELAVLVGRWLEDASGFVVEDYADLVTMLDHQMEQYFKNGVDEGVLATACDILGVAVPNR